MSNFQETDSQPGKEASQKPLQPIMHEGQPLYRQVEDWLEGYIRSHELVPGDALPSIATISKTLGIHGLTVRRAIRELAVRDVLVTHQGRGMFVSQGAQSRVLWVSGSPLFALGVSQYQAMLIERVSLIAAELGMQIEPVSVSQFDATASRHWVQHPDKLRQYGGFIFCNCGLDHLLAHHVFNQRLPAVNIAQRGQVGPWQVTTDLAQSDELAMDAMEAGECKHVAVIGIDNQPLVSASVAKQRGLKPIIVRIAPRHPVEGVSAEQVGYELGCALLRDHPGIDGWYLTDDIIARGATRAILAHTSANANRPRVVVRTSRQQIIPLGMPVHYVVFDMEEQANQLVNILHCQMTASSQTDSAFFISRYSIKHAATAPGLQQTYHAESSFVTSHQLKGDPK